MNKTEQDARNRVQSARTGCMEDATETYMVRLRAELMYWMADIEAELALRDFDRNQELEAKNA